VRQRPPVVPALLALACLAQSAYAQAPIPSAFDADFLRDLPSGRDVFSLLETAEPLTIADRIDGGGLFTGEAGRLSARGASWTQTTFLLDGVDITDPLTGGRPLLLPWDEAFTSAGFGIGGARQNVAAPGPLIGLMTRLPGDAWTGILTLDSTLGRGDQSVPPRIARLDHWRRGALTVAGPLVAERAGLFVSAQAGASDRFRRDAHETEPSEQRSLLAGLDWRAGAADRVRLLVGGQTTEVPLSARSVFADEGLAEDGRTLHARARWERTRASGAAWTLTGAYTHARTQGDLGTSVRSIERLIDGPAALLAAPGQTTRGRAEAIAGYAAAPRGAHAVSAGLRLRRSSARVDPATASWTVAERVDGIPARIWEYAQPRALDLTLDEAVLHVSDTWRIGGRATVDATLPLLYARSADRDASWLTLAPRVSARVKVAGPLDALASWSRDAHALRLEDLAYGDPDAVTASSLRWNDRDGNGAFDETERGILLSRSGPGAPVGSFDAEVPRPRTDEWRVGLEAALGPHVRARLEGIARKSRGLWESVNTGVTENGYDVFFVPDASGDLVGPSDDQLLPIYDRRPASFGRDALLLTSPDGHDSLYEGVEFQLVAGTPRARIWVSGTAHRAVGSGAFRGYRPAENDQGLVGELYDDPNANTFERGRLFSDRAYTIKIAGAWHAPGGIRLGSVARYQDGQPFSRVVVVPDLRQGADFVMAIPRGRARFTFAISWDARAEKTVAVGRAQVGAVFEVFNLLDNTNEVEEDEVTGPAYRAMTALQPPRTFRAGVRLGF
jgi:hypothetical protein